jgi:hypothetical protein
MLDRFSIYQINALSSHCYFSKILLQRKEACGYVRVILKKEEEKKKKLRKKIYKCPRYLKQ